jgi:DNA polymerase-3 subunit alpha
VNKRALESLIKAGALDSTGDTRQAMHDAVEAALAHGARQHTDRLAGQGSIFDLGDEPRASAPRHHRVAGSEEWEKRQLLAYEKEALGLYVSEHPLDGVKDALRRKSDCAIGELERRREGEVVTVGGIVGALKALTTKKGEPMVFLRLDDLSASIETVVFNSVYSASRDLLEPDRVLLVKGRVDHKQEGETKLIAIEVLPFEAAPERSELRLRVDARRARAGLIRELAELLRRYPGEAAVVVALETSEGRRTLAFGPAFRVAPAPDFYAEVRALLGEAAVA